MAGTRIGGLKSKEKNKKLYGDDFYKKIGHKGGKISKGGGFAGNPTYASKMGKLGGKRSPSQETYEEYRQSLQEERSQPEDYQV